MTFNWLNAYGAGRLVVLLVPNIIGRSPAATATRNRRWTSPSHSRWLRISPAVRA